MNAAINGVFTLLSILWNGIYSNPYISFPIFVGILGIVASVVKQARGE